MRPEQGEVDGAAFFAQQRLAWTEKQFQAALLAWVARELAAHSPSDAEIEDVHRAVLARLAESA